MDRLLIEHAYFLPFKKSNSEFKQQLKKKLTMHLVSIYYIYDTNKKQSQPLQRDIRPIYIHLTMMKFILTDLVIN